METQSVAVRSASGPEVIAALRRALDSSDAAALLALVKGPCTDLWGINHSTVTSLWAAAMTLRYGPVGLHAAWCNADESPSDEAIERFPCVHNAMIRAREKARVCLDCLSRERVRG